MDVGAYYKNIDKRWTPPQAYDSATPPWLLACAGPALVVQNDLGLNDLVAKAWASADRLLVCLCVRAWRLQAPRRFHPLVEPWNFDASVTESISSTAPTPAATPKWTQPVRTASPHRWCKSFAGHAEGPLTPLTSTSASRQTPTLKASDGDPATRHLDFANIVQVGMARRKIKQWCFFMWRAMMEVAVETALRFEAAERAEEEKLYLNQRLHTVESEYTKNLRKTALFVSGLASFAFQQQDCLSNDVILHWTWALWIRLLSRESVTKLEQRMHDLEKDHAADSRRCAQTAVQSLLAMQGFGQITGNELMLLQWAWALWEMVLRRQMQERHDERCSVLRNSLAALQTMVGTEIEDAKSNSLVLAEAEKRWQNERTALSDDLHLARFQLQDSKQRWGTERLALFAEMEFRDSEAEDATASAKELAEARAAGLEELAEAKATAAEELAALRAASAQELAEANAKAAAEIAEVREAAAREVAEANAEAERKVAEARAAAERTIAEIKSTAIADAQAALSQEAAEAKRSACEDQDALLAARDELSKKIHYANARIQTVSDQAMEQWKLTWAHIDKVRLTMLTRCADAEQSWLSRMVFQEWHTHTVRRQAQVAEHLDKNSCPLAVKLAWHFTCEVRTSFGAWCLRLELAGRRQQVWALLTACLCLAHSNDEAPDEVAAGGSLFVGRRTSSTRRSGIMPHFGSPVGTLSSEGPQAFSGMMVAETAEKPISGVVTDNAAAAMATKHEEDCTEVALEPPVPAKAPAEETAALPRPSVVGYSGAHRPSLVDLSRAPRPSIGIMSGAPRPSFGGMSAARFQSNESNDGGGSVVPGSAIGGGGSAAGGSASGADSAKDPVAGSHPPSIVGSHPPSIAGSHPPSAADNSDAGSDAGRSVTDSVATSVRSAAREGTGEVKNRFERRLSQVQAVPLNLAAPGAETPEAKILRLLTEAVQAALGKVPEIKAMSAGKFKIEGKDCQVKLMSDGKEVRIRNGGAWDPVEKMFKAKPAGGGVPASSATARRPPVPGNARTTTPPRAGVRR